MRLILPLIVFSVMTDSSWSQTTREPQKDITQKTTVNTLREDKVTVSQGYTNSKDMWESSSADSGGLASRIVDLRAPHSVTKLAKTITYGFHPYFSKGYFEPFERRPKLVTLVAFRKNGLIPRKTIKVPEVTSSEVAELQSPFNGISNFWMDAPAENPI